MVVVAVDVVYGGLLRRQTLCVRARSVPCCAHFMGHPSCDPHGCNTRHSLGYLVIYGLPAVPSGSGARQLHTGKTDYARLSLISLSPVLSAPGQGVERSESNEIIMSGDYAISGGKYGASRWDSLRFCVLEHRPSVLMPPFRNDLIIATAKAYALLSVIQRPILIPDIAVPEPNIPALCLTQSTEVRSFQPTCVDDPQLGAVVRTHRLWGDGGHHSAAGNGGGRYGHSPDTDAYVDVNAKRRV